jgi:hypothetical protein
MLCCERRCVGGSTRWRCIRGEAGGTGRDPRPGGPQCSSLCPEVSSTAGGGDGGRGNFLLVIGRQLSASQPISVGGGWGPGTCLEAEVASHWSSAASSAIVSQSACAGAGGRGQRRGSFPLVSECQLRATRLISGSKDGGGGAGGSWWELVGAGGRAWRVDTRTYKGTRVD